MPKWEVTFDACVCQQVVEADTAREAIDCAVTALRNFCDAVLVDEEQEAGEELTAITAAQVKLEELRRGIRREGSVLILDSVEKGS